MIHWKIDDGIGLISLDCPQGNMLGMDDLKKINRILSEGACNVDGWIIEGRNRSFCTGLQVNCNTVSEPFELLDKVLLSLYSVSEPLTISLTGHAIGAGFLMLCCADYVVSSDNERMKFGLPELKLGLGVDEMMVSLLHSSIPIPVIEQLLYSGEYVSYHSLNEWNLIDCVSEESQLDECIKWIHRINENKDGFRFCKQTIRKQKIMEMRQLIQLECFHKLAEFVQE